MTNVISYSTEVQEAIEQNKPIVALESTIISHGMPYPQNVETAREVEQIVRDNGAVPATIALMDGHIKIGLSDEELEL
ncbi:pseudouridine-5'-phosphate glycosidase, partial [Bacillus sp. SIMBA_161]